MTSRQEIGLIKPKRHLVEVISGLDEPSNPDASIN
jgi:hypothetical protein